MVAAFVLGVVIWLFMMWIKRRVVASSISEDIGGKLPKDFLDNPALSKEIKLGAYNEARKKYLDSKKTLKKDMLDEVLIRHNVQKEHGYVSTNCNEGAFALFEQRKKKNEAIRRMQKETKTRLEKDENAKQKKNDNSSK